MVQKFIARTQCVSAVKYTENVHVTSMIGDKISIIVMFGFNPIK